MLDDKAVGRSGKLLVVTKALLNSRQRGLVASAHVSRALLHAGEELREVTLMRSESLRGMPILVEAAGVSSERVRSFLDGRGLRRDVGWNTSRGRERWDSWHIASQAAPHHGCCCLTSVSNATNVRCRPTHWTDSLGACFGG